MDDVMLRWQIHQIQQVEKNADIIKKLKELLAAAEAGEITSLVAIAPMTGGQAAMKWSGNELELMSCLDIAKATLMGRVTASTVPLKKIGG